MAMKLALVILFGTLLLAACGGAEPTATSTSKATSVDTCTSKGGPKIKNYTEPPPITIDQQKRYVAKVCTNKGAIVIELFAKETPRTVNNFVTLARDGYYDGVVFHRVIKGFMIQGGDPTGTGAGGPGYSFEDEIVPSLVFDRPGLLAMANSGGGNTNGSQFFITLVPTPHLNGAHTIFGRVTEGQEVVDAIVSVKTAGDRPVDNVVIDTIEIQETSEGG